MDLTSPQTNTLKINSKKGNVLVDPDFAEDAKIIILSDGSTSGIDSTDETLVIYGPGDFESNGILIKGSRTDGETMYSIDTDDGKMLVVLSTSITKLADEDEFNIVAVKAVGPVDEATLSALSSGLVVVYGSEEFIPDSLKSRRINKVVLKKRDEIEGNVVYLEKK